MMPGWELYGSEERHALNDLFDYQNGIMFAHGFDKQRNGLYQVREFEGLFATRMGVAHAQAVSSGSAAVKVALQAAGVRPGDEVITSCFTFIATVEAILEVGAVPVLVDIDATLNMDPKAAYLAQSENTKALLPVHMFGECCEMEPGPPTNRWIVIEDACQALGASYLGRPAGTMGKLGAYSFDGGKTLCTGEGGMVVTNNARMHEQARAYHDHGHAYADVPRGLDHQRCRGFNYRMTEMQAAVGIAQLGKLDRILMLQRRNKRLLFEAIRCPTAEPDKDFSEMGQIAHAAGLVPPLVLNRWLLRQGADPKGDAGDSLVFFCDTREQANKFVHQMGNYGLSTKNLPDALNWHFADRWPLYMRKECRMVYQESPLPSAALLERAVAIPIMVNWSASDIADLASTLRQCAKEVK